MSRRQYDNARLAASGFRNRADYERRHADPTYRHFMDRIIRAERKPGESMADARRRIDRPGSTASRDLLAARQQGYGKRRAGRGLKSPMARILVRAGMRDPNATYPVGGSPPRRK